MKVLLSYTLIEILYLFIYLLIYLFVYLFIYLFMYLLFTYLFIYLFKKKRLCSESLNLNFVAHLEHIPILFSRLRSKVKGFNTFKNFKICE